MNIKSLWPFVSKKKYETDIENIKNESDGYLIELRAIRERFFNQEKRHEAELEEHSAVADKVIQRLSDLQWHRRDQSYCMSLEFDPRITDYGSAFREELEFIAWRFGRQVENEIRSCKFVKSTKENQRKETAQNEYRRAMR